LIPEPGAAASDNQTGRLRISPKKFFFTKNPLPIGDRPGRTRLWAPSLPCDIAVRATRRSIFRVSNRPWAQVK
jgi:hypothetical protein